MWLWWVISLLILVSCIIFAWRMIVSSYEFLPIDKRFFFSFYKKDSEPVERISNNRPHSFIRNTKQFSEDTSAFYQIEFTKFNERLKAIEDLLAVKSNPKITASFDQEEDWKELYYQENEAKEKLENELDNLRQQMEQLQAATNEKEIEEWKELYYAENEVKVKLENELDITRIRFDEAQAALETSLKNVANFSSLQVDYEEKVNNVQQLENTVSLLQKQISASVERENELENLLISEIIIREKYALLQSKYGKLQMEANDLEQRILEQSQREMNLEVKLMRLNELESKLALCEEESRKLKTKLEGNTN